MAGFLLRRRIAAKILIKSTVYAFALFGLLFILLLSAVLGFIQLPGGAAEVPDEAVLALNFDEAYGENRVDTLLTEVTAENPLSFQDLLWVMSAAAFDDRVKAIAAKVNQTGLGLAQIEELRQAVLQLRANGKSAYVYAPGFGSLGNGTAEYYLATVFDEITMAPKTDIGITGLAIETPFLRGMLDKVGITPEFFARREYKSAMVSFTDKKAGAALRNNMMNLVQNLNQTVLAQSFGDRFHKAVKAEEYKKLVALAPLSAQEGLKLGLIDQVSYENDWLKEIENRHKAKAVTLADYAAQVYIEDGTPKFAVLTLEGEIGSAGLGVVSGDTEVSAEEVLAMLNEIREDKDVRGVLVRINSPGGSYTASAEIWNALLKLKAARKIPLIVSMGDYAASGGYLVALAGDKIFADATTVTASIGVAGGKFELAELWKKLGVEWEVFADFPNAAMDSLNRSFTKFQKELFNKALDAIYADFTLKVSQARKLTLEQVDKVARGRVLSGAAAYEAGLVDNIGGLEAALGELKSMAGLTTEDSFGLDFYPKPRSFQDKLNDLIKRAPMISKLGIKNKLGLDIQNLIMLKRLKYDAVLPPMRLDM